MLVAIVSPVATYLLLPFSYFKKRNDQICEYTCSAYYNVRKSSNLGAPHTHSYIQYIVVCPSVKRKKSRQTHKSNCAQKSRRNTSSSRKEKNKHTHTSSPRAGTELRRKFYSRRASAILLHRKHSQKRTSQKKRTRLDEKILHQKNPATDWLGDSFKKRHYMKNYTEITQVRRTKPHNKCIENQETHRASVILVLDARPSSNDYHITAFVWADEAATNRKREKKQIYKYKYKTVTRYDLYFSYIFSL